MNASTNQGLQYLPNRMTVFAVIWASQALVHQDFFPQWLEEGSVVGWLVTILAVATLLYPRSLVVFSGLLVTSIAHNFDRWPFVANHILLDLFVELTILLAIAWAAYLAWRRREVLDDIAREKVFDRFAPVLAAMLVAVYYVIFLSKLNWDFVNLDTSCLTGMYQDVVDRFGPLPIPTGNWALELALWVFLLIEIVLPVFLTFRKTRHAAILIGLPFHLLLGLIGHRTFSAFVFGLYAVFCMGPVTELLAETKARLPVAALEKLVRALRIGVPAFGLAAALIYLMGDYTEPTGLLAVFAYGYHVWFFWSCTIGLVYAVSIFKHYSARRPVPSILMPASRPGFLWVFFAIVTVNGLSPYLGLKTETSYTMYSNLRTEAEINNHMFMPALRLANYQDDLVEIVSTDHPRIKRLSSWHPLGDRTRTPREKRVPYFELRRAVSETKSDFFVEYIRDGQRMSYRRQGGAGPNTAIAQEHPFWLGKLLYFRPVFASEQSLCQH